MVALRKEAGVLLPVDYANSARAVPERLAAGGVPGGSTGPTPVASAAEPRQWERYGWE